MWGGGNQRGSFRSRRSLLEAGRPFAGILLACDSNGTGCTSPGGGPILAGDCPQRTVCPPGSLPGATRPSLVRLAVRFSSGICPERRPVLAAGKVITDQGTFGCGGHVLTVKCGPGQRGAAHRALCRCRIAAGWVQVHRARPRLRHVESIIPKSISDSTTSPDS